MKYVHIHALKIYPYGNPNRDDAGMPKTLVYGDSLRGRVSSQSFKHAIKQQYQEKRPESEIKCARTRHLGRKVVEKIMENPTGNTVEGKPMTEETAWNAWRKAMELAKIKINSKDDKQTEVGYYVSYSAIDEIAEIVSRNADILVKIKKKATDADGKKIPHGAEIQKAIRRAIASVEKSTEISAFGRMMAISDVDGQVESALQVPAMITIGGASVDDDFFTAIDDINRDDDKTGAAITGVLPNISGTFYGNVVLELATLQKNLERSEVETMSVVRDLVESITDAFPSAKGKTCDANVPVTIYLASVSSKGMPTSLAGAFQSPVRTTHERSEAEEGAKRMLQEIAGIEKFQPVAERRWYVAARSGCEKIVADMKSAVPNMTEFESVPKFIEAITSHAEEILAS
ncbi:MAG: type I-E CRISPR-associated protein Cas7/Cse4/CasC [Isosphaeraceae bacterium]